MWFCDLAVQDVRLAEVEVARDDRELDQVDEFRELLRAVVELVVADRHGVEADGVHELGLHGALVGRVHERALELVARVEHDDVAAFGRDRVAQLVDLGGEARDAAEAFAGRVVLGRAGRIEPLIGSIRLWRSLMCRTCSV
jgi:hypothetical protein